MGLGALIEDLGELASDAGKTMVDAVDVFGDAPLVGLANPGLGLLAQLDHVAELGGRLVDWADDIGLDKVMLAATSPILAAGQAKIAALREQTGSGEPECGDRLAAGASDFRQATEVLMSAHPDGDWSGSGAESYSAADTRQQGRTTTLAELDDQLRTLIATEASQLRTCRSTLDDQSNWLAEVGLMTAGYGLLPGFGIAAKETAELEAVSKALDACTAALQQLSGEVSANAAAVNQLVGQYSGVAEGTGSGGCPPGQGGTYDDPRGRTECDGTTPFGAPGSGGELGGGGSGSGGGSGTGSGSGGATSASPSSPDVPSPALPEPASGTATDAASDTATDATGGAAPGSLGGLPPALGGAPSGSGAGMVGGLAALIAEVIKAATQNSPGEQSPAEAEAEAAEQKKQEERAAQEEARKPGEDVVPDGAEARAGKSEAGKPDADSATQSGAPAEPTPEAAPGDVQRGRAPIHVELDVEPAGLTRPMTVTLDRDRPIVLPPTATT